MGVFGRILFGATLSLVSYLVYNSAFLPSKQLAVPIPPKDSLDYNLQTPKQLAERLSEAVKLPTISYERGVVDSAEYLLKYHAYLEKIFPLVHQNLKKEVIGLYSLVYEWTGSDPSLKPIMICGHMDVVPVENETNWSESPFTGKIDNEFIWGRGTLDDKPNIVGLLEAIEDLLSKNFKPNRSIILAFGHDEEVSGFDGAGQIALYLQSKNVQAEYILDEGLVIASGVLSFVPQPMALIGVVEKGYVTLELSVNTPGGHSSMPPVTDSTIGILSKAIVQLETQKFPTTFEFSKLIFDYLTPELSFLYRILLKNSWLFSPLLVRIYEGGSSTNAQIRTTTAVTLIQGGLKENVLPQSATALVNFRIIPSESTSFVLEHAKKIINDPRVAIKIKSGSKPLEPSPVTPVDTQQFNLLHTTIKQVFPEVLVSAGMMSANTDTRHYWGLSKNIFRFSPLRLNKEDISRIHGTDERISINNYVELVHFYHRLIRNSNGKI